MTDRDELMNHLKIVDEAGDINERKSAVSDEDTKKKALEDERVYSEKGLLEDNLPGTDSPRYGRAEFDSLDEDDKNVKRSEGFRNRALLHRDDAISNFKNDLEGILTDNTGAKDEKLLRLANAEQVVKSTTGVEKTILQAYAQVRHYEQMIADLGKNKRPELKDEQEAMKVYSAASARAQLEAARKAGYSEELAQASAKLAESAPSEELSNDDLKKGIEGLKERSKELAQRYTRENFADDDYEAVVRNAVYRTLKRLVESDSPDANKQALQLYYHAQTEKPLRMLEFE